MVIIMYWYNEGIVIDHEDRELDNVRVLWHGQVGKSGDQLPHWRLEWSQKGRSHPSNW